ncbi:MAG TPA: hypothetical protein VHM30_07095 [Gemmatimonadaceae bacterium]|nr:hypothetical protein [Gemmatimonadaceae bacterium]
MQALASPTAESSLVVRPARPEDDAARRALLGAVAMDAELSLSVRRTPTVDAMYALHASAWDSWVVATESGEIAGMGSVLVRDAWVGDRVAKVGYLGDLRLSGRAEGRMLLDRAYGPILEAARERHGVEYWLTAIIASNARARRALTVQTERAARRGRPRYTLLREFDIRSLHLVLPRRRERSVYTVRRAGEADIAAIAALLDADARARPFGYPMPERELRRRLAIWPRLAIESFHLAEDARGRLAGVVAPWDASPVKETVVAGYRGAMRRVRLLHDIAALASGRPRLPAPGQPFRYQYLTHLAVPSGDPAVLRALLASAYRAAREARFHFLSACAPDGDALDRAYDGYLATNLRAQLYLVTLPDTKVPESLRVGRMPGFEMALV